MYYEVEFWFWNQDEWLKWDRIKWKFHEGFQASSVSLGLFCDANYRYRFMTVEELIYFARETADIEFEWACTTHRPIYDMYPPPY